MVSLRNYGVKATDNGTYIIISFGGSNLIQIRKSDGQIMSKAGYDSDVTF